MQIYNAGQQHSVRSHCKYEGQSVPKLYFFFWGYIKDAVCVLSVPITAPKLPGRTQAAAGTIKPPGLQMSGINFNTDMVRAGLLTVPSLNICKLLSVGYKNTTK
jgi:hypothetical protein